MEIDSHQMVFRKNEEKYLEKIEKNRQNKRNYQLYDDGIQDFGSMKKIGYLIMWFDSKQNNEHCFMEMGNDR